jgi:ABC-2 type transport system permease protein
MQAVVDEKENRTMEVLATSVSPMQLIGGKVMGIVAISLTQLAAWAVVTVLGILLAANAGIGFFQDLSMDMEIILSTLIIAVPAYVLASALMTSIGVIATTASEGQSISAVFLILHLIPIYLSWLIIPTPNDAPAVVLSFLPFTALMTICLRNLFASVPMWQVAVSAVVQTLTAVGALWLASRSFRMGMLRYGQRLKWLELIKARSK